jgi:hypothetical protein
MIYNLYKQLNDLFKKHKEQVIIKKDTDPIEVIPANNYNIHVWGANVTNWNLPPCNTVKRKVLVMISLILRQKILDTKE